MRKILGYWILFYSCGQSSTYVNQKILTNSESAQYTKVNVLPLPFVIGDSILKKSTYVEMRGYELIDPNMVNQYLQYESRIDKTQPLNAQAKFYMVGQLPSGNCYIIIYLKSFLHKFVHGGTRDIYKMATFDKKGRYISQLDLASFDSSTKEGNIFFWNTARIGDDLSIELNIRKEEADYAHDTSYILLQFNELYTIDNHGTILHIKHLTGLDSPIL